MGITFFDYPFTVLDDGTLIMDSGIDLKKLRAKSGDKYEIIVTPDGIIVFKKIKE